MTLPMLMHDINYTDCGLLLAIILGSTFVYNRGSILPKKDPFRDLFYETPQIQDDTASSLTVTRNLGEKARDSGARFIVLWGSQSGTAESLANRLARDFQQRLKEIAVVGDLSDYDPETLPGIPDSVVVILVMSTYGEGDPSDNAQEFVSYATTPSNSALSHLRFAAFGCGNSSYRYFNKVIDDVVLGMEQNGAKLILPVGAGDEATRSTREDFLEWKERLILLLVSQYGLSDHKAVYQPTVDIKIDAASSETSLGYREDSMSRNDWTHLPITSRRTIAHYEGQARTCIDLKLDITDHPQIKYRTGDHIAIWPSNPKEEVDRLLRVLGRESQRDGLLRITPADELTELRVPSPTTLQALFSEHLDICARVPRETVLAMAQLTPSAKVKNELQRIGSNRETYSDFLDHNYVTLARLMELMNAFDPDNSWTSIPLSFIIDFAPAMQTRLYSISTSSIVEPRQVGIVISVKPGIVPKLPDSAIHGVASTYLSTTEVSLPDIMSDTNLVRAEIRRSSFKLPSNPEIPVLMVAAGTGIAPFRAFIQDRARLASIGRAVGPMLLFFGSQNEADCLYSDELEEIESSHASSLQLKLVTAFSRPQPDSAGRPRPKMYVQDQVSQHCQDILQYMLEEDAALYICGATTMAKAVGDVILERVLERNQWSAEVTHQWRQERKRAGRWHEDVWS